MEVRILGSLELVGAGGAVAVSAPQQRRLLAALLVEPGVTRSTDALVDALWGSVPPASAPKLLQVYVSKLRRQLPACARIATRGAGYALELDEHALDATRFERLVTEARAASREGNPALAVALLRRALGLWRGAAYGELAFEDFARAAAERLEELRLVALEERIEAELRLGRHGKLLPELRSLVRAHPLREPLQALAMLALYRSGQQAEALEVYASTRTKLVEELGLEPGQQLRDLQRRILQHDPGLDIARGDGEASASLPAPPNPLLGRERELEELRELVGRDEVRLIVLTGAGGSGKTRLALEVARRYGGTFANGVAFVGLAPVRDPALLASTISTALGLPATGDPHSSLTSALATRELLLVLDNAEHVRAGMPILADILAGAPRVTILVTSRVVLHLSGEHVYPVAPLGTDAALELFVERAQEADARFRPEPADEAAIRGISERLDRLPLAIELAASRVRMLTPTELLGRLDARLPLLVGGPRDLPARQRTLRATLEWSFDLLDADERRDLARLSVFAGGCTLQTAEAVCDISLERLSSLVDHHLVVRSVGPHGSRYSLLETIREFAAEQLEACGELDALRRRHARQLLSIAKSLGLSVDELGSGLQQRHDLALADQDDLRAALDWALDEDPELGLELAVALAQFWVAMSPREGMQRFESLLEAAGAAPPELRARALRDLGGSAWLSGETKRAAAAYERSLEIFERLRHESGIVRLLQRLANIAFARGDLTGARRQVEAGLLRADAGGMRYDRSKFLATLSHVEFAAGNAERALELQLAALEVAREVGGLALDESGCLGNAAEFSYLLGRHDDAEAYARQALERSREIGDHIMTGHALTVLVLSARALGEHKRAGRLWGAIGAEEQQALLGRWSEDRDPYQRRILTPESTGFNGAAFGGSITAAGSRSMRWPQTSADHEPALPRGK